MRLSQLFEYGRMGRNNRQVVTVPIHREVETTPGEYDEVTFTATFEYTIERDPFGTGDSPTEYNMEIIQLVGPDGKEVSVDTLSDEEYERAQIEAHENLE